MNNQKVRFCSEVYEVRAGDVINFRPGGKAHAIAEADYLWSGREIIGDNFSLKTTDGERFIVPQLQIVHIIRPANMMVRILESDMLVKAGDVVPAFWYIPELRRLAQVPARDTLSDKHCYRMAPGLVRDRGEFEIVEEYDG